MEALKSCIISPLFPIHTVLAHPNKQKTQKRITRIIYSLSSPVQPDPWTLSDGNNNKPKPFSKNRKNPLSDDNARRIIKAKARYLSQLRRNQGSNAETPRWIKRTPEQMVRYLEDDRNGHIYGKHVVAAIQRVRSLSGRVDGGYDMRREMGDFVAKLTFTEMCTVLKEQKGWRQARDFFDWMKLQLSYRPSVIVYTLMLRIYGQVGKLKLAEQTFLEMLEAGCEPDEIACGTMLCLYAKWGRHKAMLSFYSAVQERGVILSVSVFNFMLSSLQKKSLHEKVIELWKEMIAKRIVPNQFTYTVAISSFVKKGLTQDGLNIFYQMKKFGIVPEESTYSLLISSSRKNGRHDEAVRLYEEMKSQRIVPSNYTCADLLTIYYKNEDYSKAVSLFLEMEKNKIAADEVIYGWLIKIYGKLGLYEDAKRTFEEIKKAGLLTDEKTYTSMALVYLNSGDFEGALNIMEQMRSRNILFSRFAYIVSLRCNILKGDLVSAEATFEALSRTGTHDSRACNDMINFYMNLGLKEKAKDLIIRSRKGKVQFDEELLKTVTAIYCREGTMRDVEQLINEITTTGNFEDNQFVQTFVRAMKGELKRPGKTEDKVEDLDHSNALAFELLLSLYLTDGELNKLKEVLALLLNASNGLSIASQLVNKFIKEGNVSKAECLYKLVIELGHHPEHVASASLITFYWKQKKAKQARAVMEMIAGSPVNTNQLLYNAIVDVFAKSGELEAAHSFYKEASKEGNDLGAVATTMLVNALIDSGKYIEAENVIRSSFHGKRELDTVAYNSFIKAMLEAGKLRYATSIFERMLSSQVSPSIQTYNTMISVYGRGRNLSKAVDMLNMARSTGLCLDEKAYTNLICYYGKAGKVREASLLFSKMQEEGIKPGKVCYNIMMNVYAPEGLYSETEDLFQTMQTDSCEPDSLTYLALIRAYAQGKKYDKAIEAFKLMQKSGISPSHAHFNLLITAFAKAGLFTKAKMIIEELGQVGLSPDIACYRTMVRGYMDYGHVKDGIALFESIRGSVELDRFIMSAAVHLYRSLAMEDKAETILNSMNSLGIPYLKNLVVGSQVKALLVEDTIKQ